MYKDLITEQKIPGVYILMNSQEEILYDIFFESISDLITNNNFLIRNRNNSNRWGKGT